MFSSRLRGSQNKVTIEVKDQLQSLIDEVVVDYVTKYIGKLIMILYSNSKTSKALLQQNYPLGFRK